MKVSEYFQSNWLTHTDLPDDVDTAVFTIEDVTECELKDDNETVKVRLGIKFEQSDKVWVMNKTCAITIAGLLGDETDEWIGQNIGLFVDDVSYKGKMVPAIRVRSRLPKEKPYAVPKKSRGKESRAAKSEVKSSRRRRVAADDDDEDFD